MHQTKQKDYGNPSHFRLTNRVKRLLVELVPSQDFSERTKILLEIVDLTPKGREYRSRLLAGYPAPLRPAAEVVLSEICLKQIAEYSQFHQLPLLPTAGVSA